MQKTPKGFRLQIGIYGRRNVGKSSLLNAVARQDVAIVSDVAGTTTDPVEKAMELLPLGPVLLIDTAGIDDVGALGEMRVDRTRKIFARTDLAVIVTDPQTGWGDVEQGLLELFKGEDIPVLTVFNKSGEGARQIAVPEQILNQNISCIRIGEMPDDGVPAFRDALIKIVPEEFLSAPTIAGDLVPPGQLAVLVVPIDLEAPRGRLILPQVQTIRDLLDNDAMSMVVKERELRRAIDLLREPPALVVTDSQAFLKVAGDTPDNIPMTSFSILFARCKGDLTTFVEGAMAIDRLQPGDRVLIAEACSHHPIGEDIGRVKIPRWLTQYVGGKLQFDSIQGHDFPANLADYQLVVHCGSCTFNRREMLSRIMQCRNAGVPITNYGVAIARSLGVFERALAPFPLAKSAFMSGKSGKL